MQEEIKTEVKAEEPQALSIIERAEKANKQAEDNIKRQEELLKRQEEIATKLLLGGRANLGEQKTKEQMDKEAIDARVAETLKRFR